MSEQVIIANGATITIKPFGVVYANDDGRPQEDWVCLEFMRADSAQEDSFNEARFAVKLDAAQACRLADCLRNAAS